MPTAVIAPYQAPGLWAGLSGATFRGNGPFPGAGHNSSIDSGTGKHGLFPTIGYAGYLFGGLTRAATLHDLGSIPTNAVVLRAKISFQADINRADVIAPVAISLHTMAPANQEVDDYEREDTYRTQNARFGGTALDPGNVPLITTNDFLGPDDYYVPFYLDAYDGKQLRAGQTMTIGTSGNLHTLWFRVQRSGVIGTGTYVIELWSTTGSAGNYKKNSLIGSYPGTNNFSSWVNEGQTYFAACFVSPNVPVTPGEVYIRELVLTPTGGSPDADAAVRVQMVKPPSGTPGSGNPNNPRVYGDPTLVGYFGHAGFVDEAALWGLGRQPPGEALLTMSNFGTAGQPWTAGQVYTYGDAGYGGLDGLVEQWPNPGDPGLANLIMQGLSNPNNRGLFSFRIAPSSGLSSDAIRAWWKAGAGQPGVGGDGPVLEFDYVVPQEVPGVVHRGIRVGRSVVNSQAMGVVRAVDTRGHSVSPAVLKAQETQAAAAVEHRGISADPAVKRPRRSLEIDTGES